MANRYCLNDSSLFVSVERSGSTLSVMIFEEGDDKKVATFTPQGWALFVLMLDEIDGIVSKLSTGDGTLAGSCTHPLTILFTYS